MNQHEYCKDINPNNSFPPSPNLDRITAVSFDKLNNTHFCLSRERCTIALINIYHTIPQFNITQIWTWTVHLLTSFYTYEQYLF